MNSETVRPIPPRCFSRRRNEISVTPAIGESTSGGLISMSRILNGLISVIKKPHEILPHVALRYAGRQVARDARETRAPVLPIHHQLLGLFPSRDIQSQRGPLQTLRIRK